MVKAKDSKGLAGFLSKGWAKGLGSSVHCGFARHVILIHSSVNQAGLSQCHQLRHSPSHPPDKPPPPPIKQTHGQQREWGGEVDVQGHVLEANLRRCISLTVLLGYILNRGAFCSPTSIEPHGGRGSSRPMPPAASAAAQRERHPSKRHGGCRLGST